MVGFPMLSGFISKYLFATAALEKPHKMLVTLAALIISTVLNAIYFLRQVVTIYSGRPGEAVSTGRFIKEAIAESTFSERFASIALVLLNLFLGLFSEVVIDVISRGLDLFA